MERNTTTISCTKHVDVRYKYLNEYVEDGIVKIVFLRLLTMIVTFSKDLNAELHEKHSTKMVGKKF